MNWTISVAVLITFAGAIALHSESVGKALDRLQAAFNRKFRRVEETAEGQIRWGGRR